MLNFLATCVLVASARLLPWSGDESSQLYERSIKDHLSGGKYTTIHVLICEDLELPLKIGNIRVIQSEDPRVLAKGKKSLYVIKVFPLGVSKGLLKVAIIDFVYALKGKEHTLARSGIEIFRYRYDTASGTYLLVDREIGH
jgi:hypothetical protein